MQLRVVSTLLSVGLASITAFAQNLAPPAPERIVIHSDVLNEDRPILVRMPAQAPGAKNKYPVLYLTDGDRHINEVGGIVDFLVAHDRCSPLIIVGIPTPTAIAISRQPTPTKKASTAP